MDTKFVVIKNEHLEVTLCTLGASIYRIIYDGKDMVLTPKDKNDFFKSNIYYGKTIGRVCGRIEAKPFLNINPQDNERGVSLHGGCDGLSTKEFSVDAKPTFAEFHYLSKDGEAGYPGNLILRVRYELIDEFGPPHDRTFVSQVVFNGLILAPIQCWYLLRSHL